MSAVSQERVTENAFRLGAAYYILKPFDTRVVVSRVRAVGQNEKGRDRNEQRVINTVLKQAPENGGFPRIGCDGCDP